MTEALHRTALSVGGRQGGQELEATQTEQPLSDLDFLILNGMDTAEIQKHLKDGIPLDVLADAARSIVGRGESLVDEPEAEDIPEEKAKPEKLWTLHCFPRECLFHNLLAAVFLQSGNLIFQTVPVPALSGSRYSCVAVNHGFFLRFYDTKF